MARRAVSNPLEAEEKASRARRMSETTSDDIGLHLSDDETLLDFLEKVARNEHLPLSTRVSAAKEVLPYKYPKLSSIDANMNTRISHEEALAMFNDALIMAAHDESHATH